PPHCTQHLARIFGLGESLLDRAVAPHFAGGEIAQPDAKSDSRVLRNGAASADLEIVGMWAKDEQVNRFERFWRFHECVEADLQVRLPGEPPAGVFFLWGA